MQVRPLRQLADGDEGDRESLTGELAGEGARQLPLEDRQGDVGVDGDVAHSKPVRREA